MTPTAVLSLCVGVAALSWGACCWTVSRRVTPRGRPIKVSDDDLRVIKEMVAQAEESNPRPSSLWTQTSYFQPPTSVDTRYALRRLHRSRNTLHKARRSK